jgi:hypothetical protein
MDDRTRGLYRKFDVHRTDGTSEHGEKHGDCQYFVMDWAHDPFIIPAILAYAKACAKKYPQLAADLRAKAKIEGAKWKPTKKGGVKSK